MAQLSDIEVPSTFAQRLILKQNAGKLYFLNRGPPVDLEIRTPNANAGIRGTEFNLEVDPGGQTTLTMIEGTVELWNELGLIKLGPQEEGKVETGKLPSRRPVIDVTSVIRWCLYYPGVLDTHDITLSPEETRVLSDSLLAYERGDLLAALANYPGGRVPSSNFERIYYAALLLSVGQVEETEAQLQAFDKPGASSESQRKLADALREVIATVKSQIWNRLTPPELPTEWLAESYSHQSRFHLVQALSSARRAVEKSPNFGFGWTRVAELEFSFGRTTEALSALENGLKLSPRNAQAIALKGFLLAAQNKFSEAIIWFEEAMALDGGLGNAWLGRGLCLIRQGDCGWPPTRATRLWRWTAVGESSTAWGRLTASFPTVR
jgi:tetratricopeptide (TPR) repeat protein